MPRATVTNQEAERFELKSCPEGFVMLKRMTYGQFLARRDIAAKFRLDAKASTKDMGGEMIMAQKKVAEYEFSKTIVDHNLEDDNGNKLDLAQPGILDILDPRIGSEISDLIDSMNQFEEDMGNL